MWFCSGAPLNIDLTRALKQKFCLACRSGARFSSGHDRGQKSTRRSTSQTTENNLTMPFEAMLRAARASGYRNRPIRSAAMTQPSRYPGPRCVDAGPERAPHHAGTRRLHHVTRMCAGFLTRTADEWQDFLRQHQLPAGRIRTMQKALADPQRASGNPGAAWSQRHPQGARSVLPDVRRQPQHRAPRPTIGEHTNEVLEAAGFTPEQIEALIASGAASRHTAG